MNENTEAVLPPEQEMPEQEMPEQEMPEQGGAVEGVVGTIEDDLPILKQIETELMRSIPTSYHAEVDRHVIKGMKIMFDPRTSDKIKQAYDDLDQAPSEGVAMGIAALTTIIDKETPGPLNPETLVPAAIILMCQALDFLAKSNEVELTDELVAETTQKLLSYMMQKLGLTPEKVAAVKAAVAQAEAQGAGEQGGIVEEQAGQMPPGQGGAPPAPPPPGGGLIQQQQQGVM